MYFEIKIIYEPSLYPHTTSLLLGHIRSTGCATGSYPITSVPHLTVKVWEDCLPPTFRDHSAIDNISYIRRNTNYFRTALSYSQSSQVLYRRFHRFTANPLVDFPKGVKQSSANRPFWVLPTFRVGVYCGDHSLSTL